jgi:outer membrane protein assembly factor BamB
VVQDGNRLRLIEQRTGTVVWKRAFDARVDGFAADAELLVVNQAVEEGSKLVGLNSADGDSKWSIEIESCRFHPVIGDHVYAISEHGRLYAIDNGEVQWQVETELLNPRSVSVSDGYLLIGPDVADEYVGVDKDEASVVWRKQIEFGNPAVVNYRQAFVPSSNAGLVRLDIATGTRLRTYSEARFVDRLVPFDRGLLYTQEPDERVRSLVLDES